MTLLDRLRAAQAARPRALEAGEPDGSDDPAAAALGEVDDPTAFVGLAMLSDDHLDAMKRVLNREMPTFPVEWAAAMARRQVTDLLDDGAISPGEVGPGVDTTTTVTPLRSSCPNCRGAATVTRIDLTDNAGWFECRACGLRWGGSVSAERERLRPSSR